ncbi:MAG: hypothetical protein ABL925_10110 [Methylococcales bacterium]
MTHNIFKTYVIAPGMILAALLVTQAAQADQSGDFFEQQQVVIDNELASQSGQGIKDATIISDANLDHNVITINPGGTLNNGSNVISGQAFADSSGIATVIQNSGNNVIIQNSTIVNVNLQ